MSLPEFEEYSVCVAALMTQITEWSQQHPDQHQVAIDTEAMIQILSSWQALYTSLDQVIQSRRPANIYDAIKLHEGQACQVDVGQPYVIIPMEAANELDAPDPDMPPLPTPVFIK